MQRSGLSSFLAHRAAGYTLPAPFYTDPAIFAQDLDLIFARHWIYVAVEPDVPQPGDCITVDIGPHAIIIVRDNAGMVHAFHNVCRHRGARLLNTTSGNRGAIVCPYHQWTYALDGALLYAAHMPIDFDKNCHSLRRVHIKSMAGLLFICLAENPPDDFDDMAAAIGPYIAPHDIAQCRIAFMEDIVEPGNWKLTMENNRECYHCSAAHPELTASIFAEGFGFAPAGPQAEAQTDRFLQQVRQLHKTCVDNGVAALEIDHLVGRSTGFRTERLPLDGAGESETLDTRVACTKLLGNITEKRLGALSLWTQPNSWHHFMSDHIVTFSVFPLTAETTLLRTKWLVHKDAVAGRDYDLQNLTAVWRATNRQDCELVGRAADGVRCSGYRPGPYCPDTESLVEKFTSWYVARMARAA